MASTPSDNYNFTQKSGEAEILIPTLPNGDLTSPISIKSVTSSTPQTITLSNPVPTFVVISSEDYGCCYRFLKVDDTTDVTSADGGNARGKVLPNTQRVEVPITGATGLSVIGSRGTALITIEQRS